MVQLGVRRALTAVSAVVLVACGVGALGVDDSEAKRRVAPWLHYQADADACADVATYDANQNGWVEQVWWDLDNDCRYDTHVYNTLYNEFLLEEMGYDMDENGRAEFVLQDTNQQVGYELLYSDLNQDGLYESAISWITVPAPVSTKDTDNGTLPPSVSTTAAGWDNSDAIRRGNIAAQSEALIRLQPGAPNFGAVITGYNTCYLCQP